MCGGTETMSRICPNCRSQRIRWPAAICDFCLSDWQKRLWASREKKKKKRWGRGKGAKI